MLVLLAFTCSSSDRLKLPVTEMHFALGLHSCWQRTKIAQHSWSQGYKTFALSFAVFCLLESHAAEPFQGEI